MSFEEDLAAFTSAERPTADVPIVLNGTGYMVHMTRMDGVDWANLTNRHPADLSVPLDRQFGYNLRTVTVEVVAQSELTLNGDPVEVTEAQWRQMVTHFDGGTFSRLADAVFELNQIGSQAEADALKKALAGALGNSSNSRSRSVSPRGGSKGGNRKRA